MRVMTVSAEQIARNVAAVRESLAGHPQVTLVAVSKTHSAAAVRAAAAAGVVHFGENYLQEASEKISACADLPLVWHFVGGVQTRKAARIARQFGWVHSVDSEAVAARLDAARAQVADAAPLNVLIQVNINDEASKSGVSEADLPALAVAVAAYPHIKLRGLMALPMQTDDPAVQTANFKHVANLQQQLKQNGLAVDCLSMGMSGDYPAALAAGATHIRLGSLIFGERAKKQ